MWSNHFTIGQHILTYRSRFKYIIYVYYIHSTRIIHYHWLLLLYRIVQKMKSTNKYLSVKSQVVLFLLFRIFFSIYIKKSLKKITDNHFSPLQKHHTDRIIFLL